MTSDSDKEYMSIRADYDVWHEQMSKDDEVRSPPCDPWYKSVYRELQKHSGGRLLEVGCGRGGFAVYLAKTAPRFEIVGVDFSKTAIEIARRTAAASGVSVEFVQGDAESLQFRDASFDIVVSCECMEHVSDPPKMARELSRVLKQGGKLCLTTPSQLNGMMLAWLHAYLSGRAYDSGAGVQPRERFYFFWTVRSYLRQAGFSIERMESSTYQWLLLPSVAPAKLCTRQFKRRWARRLAFPFGLHFSFFGHKTADK